MVVAMMTIGAFAQADLVKQFGNKNGVMGITITSEMLQLIPKEEMAEDNPEIAVLLDKLESMQMLTCSSEEVGRKLVSDVIEVLRSGGYKEVLSPKDGDNEEETGYFKALSSDRSSLVFCTKEERGTAVVMMNGTFTWDDLKALGIREKK